MSSNEPEPVIGCVDRVLARLRLLSQRAALDAVENTRRFEPFVETAVIREPAITPASGG